MFIVTFITDWIYTNKCKKKKNYYIAGTCRIISNIAYSNIKYWSVDMYGQTCTINNWTINIKK